MISSLQTRLSMQARRSTEPRHSLNSIRGDREGLIRAYDEEEAAGFGLTDLAEDTEDEHDDNSGLNGHANGKQPNASNEHIEMGSRKAGDR